MIRIGRNEDFVVKNVYLNRVFAYVENLTFHDRCWQKILYAINQVLFLNLVDEV